MNSVPASYDGDPAAHDADSAGCLFIAGCYADLAHTLSPLVAEAASRIMRSPSLSDFIELRFADIGPRPKRAEQGAAVERIAHEFARPCAGAGRNYFALLIADRSAAAVEQVLADCGADPVVGTLPMLRRGIATEDDRRRERPAGNRLPAVRDGVPSGGERMLKQGGAGSGTSDADGSPIAADVVILKTGSWEPEGLITELRRYAEDLLHDFATASEPGLTCEQLADLLPPSQGLALEAGQAGRHAGDLQPGTARPQDGASALRDEPGWRAGRRSEEPTRPGSQREPGKRWSPAKLLKRRGHPADHTEPETASTGSVPAGAALAESKPAGTALAGTAPAGTMPVPAAPLSPGIGEAGKAPPAALLLLVLSGDEASRDRDAWRSRMAMLLDVDKKAAMISQAVYRVRALPNVHSLEDAARHQLRRAGQLSRRDLKRSGDGYNFTRVLRVVMEVLPRDLGVLGRSSPQVERPVVVICAVNVPLADGVTAQVYGKLAQQASVIWVVPEQSVDLMSPLFTVGDTRRLIYHPAVADEVVDLLRHEAAGPGRPG